MPTHTIAERSKKKNFIQGAIKRPGALRAKAKRAGALTSKGTIKKSFIMKAAKEPGRTGQQGRFALTLAKRRPKKKK